MVGKTGFWDTSPAVFKRERVFEDTSSILRQEFSDLRNMLHFPCLFAYECQRDLPARIGRITKLQQRPQEVRIHFEFDAALSPIPAEAVEKLSWELGIGDFFLNRTHWALKDVDLIRELVDADVMSDAQRRASFFAVTPEPLQIMLGSAKALEQILLAAATGGEKEDDAYISLRRRFVEHPTLRPLLPGFVRESRHLAAFWRFIKQEAGTYEERRRILDTAFIPLFDRLERLDHVPSDVHASEVLQRFDADHVYAIWLKALERRETDPEGAITSARTLLEAVLKRILDFHSIPYSTTDDLPKLNKRVAKQLRLAPDQHSEEAVKRILGGAMSLVEGIGTLRNRLSDAHARGGPRPVRPAARHASLTVNVAGAAATFLVETHGHRNHLRSGTENSV